MGGDYELIDSGDGRKLERFGPYLFERPCAQAAWRPRLTQHVWESAHATFTREGQMRWIENAPMDSDWVVAMGGVRLKLSRTDFGHLGVFPEQSELWRWCAARLGAWRAAEVPRVLNLFAYSGAATIAAALAGAEVCHVDSSKGMVGWARENAELNGLAGSPIRWIVDDAVKFLRREIRRERRYDAIILDPPTFGRGARGEVYKIDRALQETLELCARLLSDTPAFALLTSHTPGYTPIVLGNLLRDFVGGRRRTGGSDHEPDPAVEPLLDGGEMTLAGADGVWPVPSGAWAAWRPGTDAPR
jgi:23S rRNA (cytosine1962-C5)-methyltransferase